jgi:anti-anti-sigma factor
MALSMAPLSADTEPSVRFAPMIPRVRLEGTRNVIDLQGEADISTRRPLSNVLCRVIALEDGDVVVDLTEATFIDSAIARALATAQQLLDRQGRILTVRTPSRLAARLQVLGLADLIETERPVG